MAAPPNTNMVSGQQAPHAMSVPPQPIKPKLRAMTGLLITCDGALKQFLLRLNEQSQYKFVMRDLDEKHLFIHRTKYPSSYNNVQEWLRYEVEQWTKKYTYIQESASVDD